MRRFTQRLAARHTVPMALSHSAATRHVTSAAKTKGPQEAVSAEHPEWEELPDHGPVSESFNDFARKHGLCDATEFCYGAAQAYAALGQLFAKQDYALDPSLPLPEEMSAMAAELCTPRYTQALALVGAHANLRSLAAPDDRIANARITAVRVQAEGAQPQAAEGEETTAAAVDPEHAGAVEMAAREMVVEIDLLTVCRAERLATDAAQFSWFLDRMDPDDESTVLERRNTALLYQHSGSYTIMKGLAALRRNSKEPMFLSPAAVPLRTLGLPMSALDTPVKTTKRMRLALCSTPEGTARWLIDDLTLANDLVWPADDGESVE